MIETRFRTDDVPAAERFACWRERMARTICPMDMRTDFTDDFQAEMSMMRLGAAHIWPARVQSMIFHRTHHLIRLSDTDSYHLTLLLDGTVEVGQKERRAVYTPHDMYIVDTSRPFTARNPEFGSLIGLEIPKSAIPLPPEKAARVLNRRISGTEGIGALLAAFLIRIANDAGSYQDSDTPYLETALIDLLSGALAGALDATDHLSPESRNRTLVLRVRSFIQRRLGDPGLTPETVAAAQHISTAHLHRLFASQDLTCAAWIRRQRLERAYQDLADPAQATIPIHHIAQRWGFTHHATFTRAFRAEYGITPRDHRHQAGDRTRPIIP